MLLFTMVNLDKTSQSICESNILSTCKINYTLCTKKYLMKQFNKATITIHNKSVHQYCVDNIT